MIAGGKSRSGDLLEGIGILNLNPQFRQSTCSSLPSLPVPSGKVMGALALNEVPLMCSLDSLHSSKCFLYMSGIWITTDNFVEERVGASFLSIHFKNERFNLFSKLIKELLLYSTLTYSTTLVVQATMKCPQKFSNHQKYRRYWFKSSKCFWIQTD